MTTDTVIGLDFGNTNSCVNYALEPADLQRVSVATGNPPYDTVLASTVLDPQGEATLGLEAEHEYSTRREGLFMQSFKPELENQRLRERRWRLRGVRSAGHDWVHETERLEPEYVLEWTQGRYSREEILAATALLIGRLLDQAISQGASADSEVWMGVPVTATSCTRKRLLCALEAVRLSDGSRFFQGFHDVLRRVHFVLEPLAVVAAAGADLDVEGQQNVLVFDHGGGTLDLSVALFEERAADVPPVPILELAAGGSDQVAGRALDQAFSAELRRDAEIAEALEGMDAYLRDEAVESCKLDLSTSETGSLLTDRGPMEVPREVFERAADPILVAIGDEVERTLALADLSTGDIDHVVMTGGSSLVPCVQERVEALFPHLDEYRLLRYSPDDTGPGGGVESAVTDVAQGLVRFAQQDTIEQVALWDVVVRAGRNRAFKRIVPRARPYEGSDARPEIRVSTPLEQPSSEWTAIGLYERVGPDEYRYLFGLADVPPHPADSRLEAVIRRDSVFPALAVVDPSGRPLDRGGEIRLGWPADDEAVIADLERTREERLLDFMYEDAEYLPDSGFSYFARAPLTRRLRVDDYIEWTMQDVGRDGLRPTRRRGTIEKIRRKEDDELVEEMTSWDMSDFVFTVRDADRRPRIDLRTCNGAVRLAPRPDKGY